jgi:hypothetical protein
LGEVGFVDFLWGAPAISLQVPDVFLWQLFSSFWVQLLPGCTKSSQSAGIAASSIMYIKKQMDNMESFNFNCIAFTSPN